MATFRGQDGSATYAAVGIDNLRSWSLDSSLDVIDNTVKGQKHQSVKGGIARGTAQLTCLLDYVTGQQDLIDLIAVAAPAGAPGALVILTETGKSFSASALFTNYSINSPEQSDNVSVTFNFVLSGQITVAWA